MAEPSPAEAAHLWSNAEWQNAQNAVMNSNCQVNTEMSTKNIDIKFKPP